MYLHGGTSTALKEYTPAQIKHLAERAHRSLTRAQVDIGRLAFVVSPEPVTRPEVARAICRTLEELGARVVLAPQGSFGLFRGLIGRADAVICADTAAGHIANALGTPCIALCGNPVPRQ